MKYLRIFFRFLPVLFLFSCTPEQLQDITDQISKKGESFAGSYALDDGTGLTDAYLTFSNDNMYEYSRDGKIILAENYLWFTKASDFTLGNSGDYAVSSGILYCNGIPYGKVKLTETQLTIENKNYRKILGLKEERYTSIQVEGELTRSFTYEKGAMSIPVSVTKTIPSGKLTVYNTASWLSRCELKEGKLEIEAGENNSGRLRTGSVILSYPGAENVTLSVEQAYSSSSIVCTPYSQQVGNEGGNFSFTYAIQNPREGASLSASSSTDWITNVLVSGNTVSYKVAENASIKSRNGNITLTYGLNYSSYGLPYSSGYSYASQSYSVTQSSFPITVFSLNKNKLALNAGQSETLQLSVYPEDVISLWSSSNTSVATVSSTGRVRAVGNGEATITVTSSDGSKSATCTVTVTTAVTGLSLDKTSMTLSEGKSETLTATVSPSTASNKSVSWASGNTSVAKVDQTGKVTAVSKGIATITATATDGSGKSASCMVEVLRMVSSITLDKSSIVVYIGKSETLTATVTPSTASNIGVSWSSSNTSVATVSSSGVVSAVAKGTATITASAQDGSGVSKTCQVEVKQYVTRITLNKSSIMLYSGQTFTLELTVSPANANDKSVIWSSSNTDVATVNPSGEVTAISNGTATITATANDDSGKYASCSVEVVPPIDLSANGSSNCYIVSSAGAYSFRTTKGNSSTSVGSVSKAEVLWESFGTSATPSVGSIINNVSYSSNTIIFSTPSTLKNGNAVIAAKDASGNILWSWHIWVCKDYDPAATAQTYYNNAGVMMDSNLGAISATPGNVGALGLLYQWGRKDPFLGSSSISSNTMAASTLSWPSTVSSSSSNGTIAYATAHPTTFITYNSSNRDWYYTGSSSTDNTRWQSSKTIYDPCPPGWRVPDGGDNGIWSKAVGSSSSFSGYPYDSTNEGMNFSGKFGSASTIWYPAAGWLDGGLNNVGRSGLWWSCLPRPSGTNAYRLLLKYNGDVYPLDSFYRAFGLSVRCLQE